jgi:hypothetical protein
LPAIGPVAKHEIQLQFGGLVAGKSHPAATMQ